jgi:gamma-glutamyl hercynylcysteine S-oxide synthase
MHPTATESLPTSRATILERFGTVRARTLSLVESLSEGALNRVHDPLMSPIVWDLGHIATFEDLWLAQNAFGTPPLREGLGRIYDPFTAPRSERGELPYLRSEVCLGYMQAVRDRTLELLDTADLSPDGGPLLAGGLVYEMILRHEQQHSETILQTLQLMAGEAYKPARAYAVADSLEGGRPTDMLLVPEGPFEMGETSRFGGPGFTYDNERPRHEVDVAAFYIDATPVTNGDFIAFIEDGGYERLELWSAAGRRWLDMGRRLPRYWSHDGAGYAVRSFDTVDAVDTALPLCHVCWHEAEAFARYIGKRLPTEAEWEKAASWEGSAPAKRIYPWGDAPPSRELANLDQLAFGPAPGGAYPKGASPCGALQMTGDVWEWTASGFQPYPGFEAFPYREYSEEFFGGPYRVLRGGAWATQPDAVSNTFRNWDYPERRQIFSGFRCARDAT